MPSSTSSSEAVKLHRPDRITRSTWALLACAAALLLAAETVSSFGLEKVSAMHRRIMGERRASEELRMGHPDQSRTALFVGNSLLLTGLDQQVFAAKVEGRYRAQRFVVEATNYYDWLYALERLFRVGMRTDLVVVCLQPLQLVSNVTRGDFSARFLVDARDLWPMSRDIRADLTTTSGLYVAHYSTFYAARSELRSVLMGRLSPSVTLMWKDIMFPRAVTPPDNELIPNIRERLRRMDELCKRYGSRFVLLIPPTMVGGEEAAVRAGALTGVQVLYPIPASKLRPEDFEEDGFHLNGSGARIFSEALAGELRRLS